jgi:hypothetical protein
MEKDSDIIKLYEDFSRDFDIEKALGEALRNLRDSSLYEFIPVDYTKSCEGVSRKADIDVGVGKRSQLETFPTKEA